MKQKTLLILMAVLFIGVLPFVYPLPIPADTIPGLYHPMRDLNFGFANGVPYKNFLITDPVRQQFPWKYEAVRQIKSGQWPLWNPYNFSGTPLMANVQTGAFYPLNILFFVPNLSSLSEIHFFAIQWSWYIYLQTLLSILFLYLYLTKIGLSRTAAFFGGLVWAFSGFTAAWWEWGNVIHTLLWFPLVLYAIERILEVSTVEVEQSQAKPISRLRTLFSFSFPRFLLLLALTTSFLAGHLQTIIMIVINTMFYLLFRIPFFESRKGFPYLSLTLTHRRFIYWLRIKQVSLLFFLITAIQWLPTWEFLQKSGRNVDLTQWQRPDWFFPYPHFLGLIAPDFFGHPATQNYWGVWNYGEFASYIGIIPLVFALSIVLRFLKEYFYEKFAVNSGLDIKEASLGVGFFIFALFINLVLITRNPLTESFYRYNIPFFAATQPSRGIAIVDFALVVLAAVGFNNFLKYLRQELPHDEKAPDHQYVRYLPLSFTLLLGSIGIVWLILKLQPHYLTADTSQALIAQRNLIVPSVLIVGVGLAYALYRFTALGKINTKLINAVIIVILLITAADLTRFFTKFQSFSDPRFLYPANQTLQKLQSNPTNKYMTSDSRLIAPNINLPYRISTIEGYDPLYLERYGQYIGLWERNKADLSAYPANRILTPHDHQSRLADLAGATHLLALQDNLTDKNLQKLQTEGQTTLYLRTSALSLPTVLPAQHVFSTQQELVEYMFSPIFDPRFEALAVRGIETNQLPTTASSVIYYGEGSNSVKQQSFYPLKFSLHVADRKALVYLPITYDDGWIAHTDSTSRSEDYELTVIPLNFAFSGILVPEGDHQVTLEYLPQSFILGKGISILGLILLTSLLYSTYRSKNSYA